MTHGEPWLGAEYAARENDRLWGQAWLLASHSSRVRKPGDFALFDIGHRSAIVVRGNDGALRAFANVCPHRGARLTDCSGSAPVLRCPYHAFTYGLDGKLEHAPNVDPVPALELVEVACKERFGFAWVSFAKQPEDIEGFLEPLGEELQRWALGSWSLVSEVWVALACNWKISADVHGEALHVPILHPRIASHVNWKDAEITHLGAHARIVVEPRTESVGKNTLLYVFPNVHLNLHEGEGFLLRHRPDGTSPERCQVDQMVLSPGDARVVPVSRESTADDAVIGPVTCDDFRIAERVQRGLRTGALDRPTLTDGERVLGWMMEEIQRRIG